MFGRTLHGNYYVNNSEVSYYMTPDQLSAVLFNMTSDQRSAVFSNIIPDQFANLPQELQETLNFYSPDKPGGETPANVMDMHLDQEARRPAW